MRAVSHSGARGDIGSGLTHSEVFDRPFCWRWRSILPLRRAEDVAPTPRGLPRPPPGWWREIAGRAGPDADLSAAFRLLHSAMFAEYRRQQQSICIATPEAMSRPPAKEKRIRIRERHIRSATQATTGKSMSVGSPIHP